MTKHTLPWLAALCVLGGCGTSATCNLACTDSIQLDAALTVATSSLTGATVEVCQNSVCGSGVFMAEADDAVAANLTGALDGDAWITAGAFMTTLNPGSTPFADGDVWAVTITTPAGTVVFDASTTVHYEDVPACGSTCQQANVTLTAGSAATP